MSQVNEQTADYQLADLSPALKAADADNILLESLPVWLSAQTRKSAGRGRSADNTLQYGVQKLRELILEMAVRGKLVDQDPNDEPASVLLEKITEEKARLVKEGKIKKPKLFNDVAPEEQPYLLPTGWQWVRLGLITEANTGFAFKSSEYREHGVLVLRVTNINSDGTINTQDAKFIEPLDAQEKYENFALIEDDVLLVMVGGSLGKIGIIPSDILPAVLNQNMWKLTRFGSIFRDYFVYGLKYINNNLLEITSSTHGHLAQGEYLSKPFPLPPLAEQHRIVKKVDELMALCDQLEQQQADAVQAHDTLVKVLLDSLTQSENAEDFQQNWHRIAEHFDTLFTTESSIDQLKQSLLQLAVMGKLVPQDPNDEPASVLMKKIANEKARLVKPGKFKKQTPLPKITTDKHPFDSPSGWQFHRLGELTLRIGSGSTPRGGKSAYVDSGVPFLRSQNVWNHGLELADVAYITAETHSKMSNTIVSPKDILLNITGASLGRCAIFPANIAEANVSQHVTIIRPVLSSTTEFMHLYIQSPLCQAFIWGRQVGMAREGLSKKVLELFEVPLPPLNEQHRIVKKVDELMALCDQLRDRLTQAQTMQKQLADAVISQAIE